MYSTGSVFCGCEGETPLPNPNTLLCMYTVKQIINAQQLFCRNLKIRSVCTGKQIEIIHLPVVYKLVNAWFACRRHTDCICGTCWRYYWSRAMCTFMDLCCVEYTMSLLLQLQIQPIGYAGCTMHIIWVYFYLSLIFHSTKKTDIKPELSNHLNNGCYKDI